MIENFRCKEAKKIWERRFSKRIPAEIQEMARRKWISISISESIDDLRKPPSNQFEKHVGDRKEQYSIRINSQ